MIRELTPEQREALAASRARKGAPKEPEKPDESVEDERLLIELKRKKLLHLQALDWTTWCPHAPTAKQAEFLMLTGEEAFYGGAAGGGKSDALLMAALQYVHVPSYRALILRRTYQDLSLPGAIMDRAREWWATRSDVKWAEKDKSFTFPSGAKIVFGYLEIEKDKYRYQSAEFQFVAFDELTQFEETQYLYLFSRQRKGAGVAVPIRMRSASNPGGAGHEWVFKRFIDERTRQAPFVQARLGDNAHVDIEAYRKGLSKLDPTTREQLENGLWVRDSEGLVYRRFQTSNLVSKALLPKLTRFVIGVDYGFVDATAFAVWGWREHDPCAYLVECYKREGMDPSGAAIETDALAKRYGATKIVGDVGGLGKGYAEEARRRFNVPVEPAEKHNKFGYIDLYNGALYRDEIKIVEETCKDLVDEYAALRWTDSATAKREAPSSPNHCADAALYGWREVFSYLETIPVEPTDPKQIAKRDFDRAWSERDELEVQVDEQMAREEEERKMLLGIW